jgi:Trypsin-co-occurring domain 1
MDDELAFGGADLESGPDRAARLIPVQVGGATVFVEQLDDARVETDDEIYPVGPPSPKEAFEKANEALRECIRVVGETLEGIGEQVQPQEVSLEFSLSFQAEGTAQIIPVLVTGKTGASTGLKVTATWKPGERERSG